MRRVALALLAWAVVTGCQTTPETGTVLGPSDPRAAALLAGVAAEAAQRTALRATARVSLSGQRGASFARQLLLLERPTRMRVEVVGLLGQRVAVLATDGDRYELYRAETAGVERGEMHPAILWEVAGLPLTPDLAVALLLGAPQALDSRGAQALALSDGSLRLTWPGGPAGPPRTLHFDASGRPRHYQVGLDDEVLLTAEWDDYREVQDATFAHHVELDFPGAEAHAKVSFRSVELNPALPDALFRLDPGDRVSSPAEGGP